MNTAFPKALSLKGRGTAAKRPGEGVVHSRDKTPTPILERARQLRVNQTEAEGKLWTRFRARRFHDLKCRRQVAFSAGYYADFVYSKGKLIIELDGSQHVDQIVYDSKRTAFLMSQGHRVIRFWNNDVFLEMDHVLDTNYHAVLPPLPSASAPAPPPFRGRVEIQGRRI